MAVSRQFWIKFVPKDWNGDHKLRSCSLAARGLWAAFLEPMIEAEPYGRLLINGRKPSYEELARLASCTVREVKFGVEELIQQGVCSVESDGVLLSRRLIRDAERHEKKQRDGARGGNPQLTKSTPQSDERIVPNGVDLMLNSDLRSKSASLENHPSTGVNSQTLNDNKNLTVNHEVKDMVNIVDKPLWDLGSRDLGSRLVLGNLGKGGVGEKPSAFRVGENGHARDLPPDEAWAIWLKAYPGAQRSAGFMENQSFLQVCDEIGLSVLLAKLEAQKISRQWREGFVPSMRNYFRDKLWVQDPDEKPQSDKTLALEHLKKIDARRSEGRDR